MANTKVRIAATVYSQSHSIKYTLQTYARCGKTHRVSPRCTSIAVISFIPHYATPAQPTCIQYARYSSQCTLVFGGEATPFHSLFEKGGEERRSCSTINLVYAFVVQHGNVERELVTYHSLLRFLVRDGHCFSHQLSHLERLPLPSASREPGGHVAHCVKYR